MSVITKRSRMLSIRMSDAEYHQLQAICEVRGARSISDLAREAMQRIAAMPPDDEPGNSLAERVGQLDRRLNLLQQEVLRLSSLMNRRNGDHS